MNKLLPFCFLIVAVLSVDAQNPITTGLPTTQEYGKVSKEDLEMTTCDFEKDANAEILFDKGNIFTDGGLTILERHTRIKVLNDFGKNAANIRIQYVSYMGSTAINGLQGETINIENGKTEITPLDKKLVYDEKTDRIRSTLVFALPKVKAGSIIEYKYRCTLVNGYFPDWYFQSYFPTRYSEIKIDIPSAIGQSVRLIPHVKQPFALSIGKMDDFKQTRSMANVHSLPEEPYMGAIKDNLQRLEYLGIHQLLNSWKKIADILLKAPDFGDQLDRNITGENIIISKAKAIKTDDQKIAFIFDEVKNNMKWNEALQFYTTDGTARAWDKKTGNSTEINLIMYHLLKKAGIHAYPMVMSTKKNGLLNPVNPNVNLFNSTVVYVPVDSTKYYVLDATNKYNLYDSVPNDELNTYGLAINVEDKEAEVIWLENAEPAIQSVFLNAEILPTNKMTGDAEITSFSYNKAIAAKKYKTDGEQKYINYLRNNDNNLKISSIKLENMEIDTLPLTQKINFSSELTSSDENYIFFNTNLFTLLEANPFIKEERYSNIDFGYKSNYSINGIYKLPAGYKISAIPKNITLIMPDQSISLKRTVAESDGVVTVRYILLHKKTLYFTENYQDLRNFYKALYEMLNEQIVLKKA